MPTDKLPNTFVWVENGTTDADVAKKFYAKIFGWTALDTQAGEMGTYTMLQLNGKEIGGLFELPEPMRDEGVPPHWLSYLGVADCDASTAKAKTLGARVTREPFDVMDIGRMSVLCDPTGAVFALWQALKAEGNAAPPGPGNTCWFELVTPDTAKARPFYEQLLGWKGQTQQMGPMEYTVFRIGETMVAGLLAPPPQAGDAPPYWMPYFAVERCDATVDAAESAGAEILAPPHDVPNVGRSAAILDPNGAAFSVIQLIQQPA